jgi:hypothetical protein
VNTLCLCVCGINDPIHTCDEYLVLLEKSGMTVYDLVIFKDFAQGGKSMSLVLVFFVFSFEFEARFS